jgi:tyrosine-protein kinase Etk/Wzc
MELSKTMQERDSLPPVWEDQEKIGAPIDLLSLLSMCISRWPFLVATGAAGSVLALAIALLLTPTFESQAVFLPPTAQVSSTENPLAALVKTPSSAIYTGLLLSDSVLGDVVEHTNLQAIFKSKNLADARTMLHRKTKVATDTSGFVTLTVTDKDPKLARDIASSFLAALSRLNDRLAITSAAQQRHIFQAGLEDEKNALEDAEIALAKAQEASGVVAPQMQTQTGLLAIDNTRTQIRLQQVLLASLEQSETDQAPDVVRARSQVQALEAQLHNLETGAQAGAGGALSATKAPSVNLEFVKLEREVKYHQTLFDVMAKQYEAAKIQESSAAPGVQIVDFPEIPVRKAWPSRILFAVGGGIFGLFIAFATLFVKDRLRILRADPERAASLQLLHEAFNHPNLRP